MKSAARLHATIARNSRTLAGWMGWVAFAALLLYGCGLIADGLSRGGYDDPNDSIRDLGELLVPAALSALFPLAFLEQGNVAMSFLGGRMSARTKAAMGVLVAAVVAAVVAVFALRFGKYAAAAAGSGDTLLMLDLPKYPFWRIVSINLWLTLTAQLVVLGGQVLALSQAIAEARARPRWLR